MPSAREMTIGQGFPSPSWPDKGRIATYRAGSRRQSWLRRPLCYRRRQLGGAIWGIPAKMFVMLGACFGDVSENPEIRARPRNEGQNVRLVRESGRTQMRARR